MTQQVQVSVVVPVYGSEDCVEELVRRTTEAMAAAGRRFEMILVNDGSPDRSWERIRRCAQANSAVRGVNLRRNAGQDNAIMAGLREVTGAVVVIMDDDLQHDPKDIDALVRGVEGGADICYARFPWKKQALWKNAGSWFNDKVANVVIGKPRGIYMSPFKAVASDVVKEITRYEGPFPYVDGLLLRVTGNVAQVDIEHHHRFAGRGHFTLVRSVGVWLRVATLFSLAPLRMATFLGFGFALAGLVMALYFVLKFFLFPEPADPVGWASLMVTLLVLGGAQLACLGVLGEYLGRVFLHLNRRPQFVVKEKTP